VGFGTPIIPETITVHLGAPRANARRVTVPFRDYIANVTSSEVYPTWPEAALRANIYAITSVTLNRVYTEFYRAQGLAFDITNSTQFDQAYIHGRDIFRNVRELVDQQLGDYIRRREHFEPLFASYCSGRGVTCRGMSQWGSFNLAQQGFTPPQILRHYYGNNIELMVDNPTGVILPTYPGRLLRRGSSGEPVRTIQTMLRRISRNFPLIPRVEVNTGVFDAQTEAAVRTFQRVFNLQQDGIVGPITWNRARQLFNGVKRLNELDSEGMRESDVAQLYQSTLRRGDRGLDVRALQYYLRFYSLVQPSIPLLAADGIFGPITEGAVRAYQQTYRLTADGIAGRSTMNSMITNYVPTYNRLPAAQRRLLYPGYAFSPGDRGNKVRELQQMLNAVSAHVDGLESVNTDGSYGPATANAVRAFQYFAQIPVSGDTGILTWNSILDAYEQYSSMDLSLASVRTAALGYCPASASVCGDPKVIVETFLYI